MLVRLSFHDCASATCDGCLDITDTQNNPGLDGVINAVQPVCDKFGLGTADCWAAAGSIAVEETSLSGSVPVTVPLFFGRADAPSCTGFTAEAPEATFPSASAGVLPPANLKMRLSEMLLSCCQN